MFNLKDEIAKANAAWFKAAYPDPLEEVVAKFMAADCLEGIAIPISIQKPLYQEIVSKHCGQVIYTLTGPEDAVKERAQYLFDAYPPMGYGTKCTIYPDRTVITRAGSCD